MSYHVFVTNNDSKKWLGTTTNFVDASCLQNEFVQKNQLINVIVCNNGHTVFGYRDNVKFVLEIEQK